MRTVRALVVDDSRVMRNMVKEALLKTNLADFEFVEAEDGEIALHKYNPDTIDIVFVDWNMPNITGLELVKTIRCNFTGRRTPIVMVTSERTLGKMQEALDNAGANAYITKPFTIDEMRAKVSKIIDSITRGQEQSSKSKGFFRGKLFS